MTTTTKPCSTISIFNLPEEVLQDCISSSYLTKPDQYNLFSTCKYVYPMLLKARTICLTAHEHRYEQSSEDSGYRKHDEWQDFLADEYFRNKILEIVGIRQDSISSNNDNAVECSYNQRKLRVKVLSHSITSQSARDGLVQFADFMYRLEINPVQGEYFYEEDVFIENPTYSTIPRLYVGVPIRFIFQMHRLVINEHNTIENYHELLDETFNNEETARAMTDIEPFTSLTGISHMHFNEMWNESTSLLISYGKKLEKVTIKHWRTENSFSFLKGVKEIVIENCTINPFMHNLSDSKSISISQCKVNDVSALADVENVTLMEVQSLQSIESLGKVKKLKVSMCSEIHGYPIPCGHDQEWTFSSLDTFRSVSKEYNRLLTFCVKNCRSIYDFSILGHVRFLTIKSSERDRMRIRYPLPLSINEDQEWTFDGVLIEDIRVFAGLRALTISNNLALHTIPELRRMHSLTLQHCESLEHIQWLHDFDHISISNCRKLRSMTNIKNIKELSIRECCLPKMKSVENISTLHLSRVRTNSSHFQLPPSIRRVTLVCCNDVNLQPFSDVSTILLANCNNIKNDNRVLHTKTLTLLNCNNIGKIDVSEVEELAFENCSAMTAFHERSGDDNVDALNVDAICNNYCFDNYMLRKAIELWFVMKWRVESIYGKISTWNVSKVTNMKDLFKERVNFNENIELWDVGNVLNMSSMFEGASSFNMPLDKWNVESVVNMNCMFYDAKSFNQPINSWKVHNVTTMLKMFSKAITFNQPIYDWNIHNLNDMEGMFAFATAFNQSLDMWDVRNVKNMNRLFFGATSFNNPLHSWITVHEESRALMFMDFSNEKYTPQRWNNNGLSSNQLTTEFEWFDLVETDDTERLLMEDGDHLMGFDEFLENNEL